MINKIEMKTSTINCKNQINSIKLNHYGYFLFLTHFFLLEERERRARARGRFIKRPKFAYSLFISELEWNYMRLILISTSSLILISFLNIFGSDISSPDPFKSSSATVSQSVSQSVSDSADALLTMMIMMIKI